ncbi:MAG: RHS repeat-associated core domain-containing protein [Methylococcaceae bacterium]|jgi:RHS repeat-associated protein
MVCLAINQVIKSYPFDYVMITQQRYDNNGLATKINLRFPGQYYDAETGLHYNWNRYYDPKTGSYISINPIGLQGELNP